MIVTGQQEENKMTNLNYTKFIYKIIKSSVMVKCTKKKDEPTMMEVMEAELNK